MTDAGLTRRRERPGRAGPQRAVCQAAVDPRGRPCAGDRRGSRAPMSFTRSPTLAFPTIARGSLQSFVWCPRTGLPPSAYSAGSQTVSEMTARGLVELRAGSDARQRLVHLTRKAQRLRPVIDAEWAATTARRAGAQHRAERATGQHRPRAGRGAAAPLVPRPHRRVPRRA